MSEPLRYSVPYRFLFDRLTGPILERRRAPVTEIYRYMAARMHPPPEYEGLERLPAEPRFVLAANHYQRKGLWIAHAASAISVALTERYHADPPVRWIVTANWPPWRLGPFVFRSPGDVLLPRVAHALWCYPVPFAGADPPATAGMFRRVLKELPHLGCPVGIFPEGAQAVAGEISAPLPGVGRLLRLMAARGWPIVPVGIGERGRFVIRFGSPLPAAGLAAVRDPAVLAMQQITELCG